MLPLDSAQLLTQGDPLGVGAFIRHLHPDYGTYTGVGNAPSLKTPLIGQIHYTEGARSARLSFLLPSSYAEKPEMVQLVEALAIQAGKWGAFNLLAEVDEDSPAFITLRKAGFSVYARQRVWQLPFTGTQENEFTSQWQPVSAGDEVSIRNLAQLLAPPIVQSAELFPSNRAAGLVYYQSGEIMAYVENAFGPRGIFLLPLLHPAIEDVGGLLLGLDRHLFPLFMRPVYLSVRSYQAWIESALEKLEWRASQSQALMVKHLTRPQPIFASSVRLVASEGRQIEPTVPILKPCVPENH